MPEKNEHRKWAERAYDYIVKAVEDPGFKIKGDSLEFYRRMKTAGQFDILPFTGDEDVSAKKAREIYVGRLEMMRKEKMDKQKKKGNKLSKWEKVVGQIGKRKKQ